MTKKEWLISIVLVLVICCVIGISVKEVFLPLVTAARELRKIDIRQLPFKTRLISEGEGVIANEPFKVLGGEFSVAKVLFDGGGMVPVIFNPQQSDFYRSMQKQGHKVKFKCEFYGYGEVLPHEACTFEHR